MNKSGFSVASVVVECDGTELPLTATLASLERQTLAVFQILLVGDPPGDGDMARMAPGLAGSTDRRLSSLPHLNLRSPDGWNRMIGAIESRFVVAVTAGDRFEPTALEKAAWALETTPKAGLVAIGEPDPLREHRGFGPIGVVRLARRRIELETCMLRTAAWREAGGLDVGAPPDAASQDLLIRMADRAWQAWQVPEALIHAREGRRGLDVGSRALGNGSQRWLRSRHRLFYARASAIGLSETMTQRTRRLPLLSGIGRWLAWKAEVEGVGDLRQALRHPVDSALRLVPRPIKGRLWQLLDLPMRSPMWSYDPPLLDVADAALLRPAKPPVQSPNPVRRTRLLVVHQYLTAGGAETVVLQLLSRISRERFDIHLITTEHEPDGAFEHPWLARFAEQTDSVYELPAFLRKDYFLRFVDDFIDSRSIDVVLVSLSVFAYQALPRLRADNPHTAFVDLLHAEAPYAPMDHIRLASRYREFLDQRVVITETLRSAQVDKYGERADRVLVIPNGVDTARAFNPGNSTRGSLRRELGVASEVAIVLYLGRLASEKQPMHVVLTAEKLRRRSDLVFVLQGDGSERPALEEAILARRLTNVRLIPARDDVRDALADAAIVMFPSKREGLPVAGIESMSMGKPIVASRVPGWREFVSDGVDGLLVDDGDIDGYANAITSLLTDHALRDRIARAAREKATHSYELRDVIRTWELLLATLPDQGVASGLA